MIHLLDLPQEILDLLASHCTYFELIHLEKTCKRFYYTIHNDDLLRKALIDLETYWAAGSHVVPIFQKEVLHPLEPYPPYSQYPNHAPCFTCLSLRGPGNLAYDPLVQSMLPWDTRGSYYAGNFDKLNLDRKCMDCTIQAARSKGQEQRWRSDRTGRWHIFCTRCNTKCVWPGPNHIPRLMDLGICLHCFDVANPGWLVFKERLRIRLLRIQRYEAWLRITMQRVRQIAPDGRTPGFRSAPSKIPPEDDVKEDWALWRHVFAEEPQVGWEMLHAMFKDAIAPMSAYWFWMIHTDNRYRVCTHKSDPPRTEELTALGEWPKWEWIVEEIKEAKERGCKCGRCSMAGSSLTWVAV